MSGPGEPDGPRLDGTVQPVKLHFSGNGRETRVEVAGVDIANMVRSLSLDVDTRLRPRLALDLAVFDGADFEGNVPVFVTDGTRELLLKAGWTPPGDAGRV